MGDHVVSEGRNKALLLTPITSSTSSSITETLTLHVDVPRTEIIDVSSSSSMTAPAGVTRLNTDSDSDCEFDVRRTFRPLMDWKLGYRIASNRFYGLIPIFVVTTVGNFNLITQIQTICSLLIMFISTQHRAIFYVCILKNKKKT